MRVELAARQQLRLGTRIEIGKIAVTHTSDREPQTDHFLHARIGAPYLQSHPGTETKAGKQQRYARILQGQKIERRRDVVALPAPFIVFALARAHPSKIETQNGYSKAMQCFRSLVNNFIVHRAAKQRMRMAHHGRER